MYKEQTEGHVAAETQWYFYFLFFWFSLQVAVTGDSCTGIVMFIILQASLIFIIGCAPAKQSLGNCQRAGMVNNPNSYSQDLAAFPLLSAETGSIPAVVPDFDVEYSYIILSLIH